MPKAKESTKRKSKQVKKAKDETYLFLKDTQISVLADLVDKKDAEISDLLKKNEMLGEAGIKAINLGLNISTDYRKSFDEWERFANRSFMIGLLVGACSTAFFWLFSNMLFK